MLISNAEYVSIEITRRCNMCCDHCLRGDAEDIDIQEKYIDAFLDKFINGANIYSVCITGGEIMLNIPAIRYLLAAVKKKNISVESFYMVTNGKDSSKALDLAMASLEWWSYCTECDGEPDYAGICISSDEFHEDISSTAKEILSGLSYYRNDKERSYTTNGLLNEGRAKNLSSSAFKKYEPFENALCIEKESNELISIHEEQLYLNALGDIVAGCDWSYESQQERIICNVMDNNWTDKLLTSKYCNLS